MNVIAALLMFAGSLVAVLAGIGLLKFHTPYARFHAAGKASPIAFLITAIGAGLALGLDGAAPLVVAACAMVWTLPLGVHLLFRATYRISLDRGETMTHLTGEDLAATDDDRTSDLGASDLGASDSGPSDED